MKGFLRAVIIAVLSFVILFLFFPNFSDKYLGVSFKNGDSSVKKLRTDIKDKTEEIKNDFISDVKDAKSQIKIKSLSVKKAL